MVRLRNVGEAVGTTAESVCGRTCVLYIDQSGYSEI